MDAPPSGPNISLFPVAGFSPEYPFTPGTLLGSAGNYSIRVIAPDGSASVVPVTVGLVTTNLAEVQSGVNEGDTVSIGTVSSRTTSTSAGTGGVAIPGVGGGTGGFGGRIPGN